MHKTTKRVLTASALALGLITAATTASAASGIVTTRHNLGSSNRTAAGLTAPTGLARDGDVFTTGTDEVCVFCHTPHATNTAANAPLWNKALPSTSNYTVYSSGTMQGTASLTSGSMSLACLSCHDGTQAMDNMINAPGGSGYDATGSNSWNTGVWSSTVDTNAGKMTAAAGIAMLGTDLSNDHPVGIPYGGGNCTATAGSCKDPDFVIPTASQGGFAVGGSTVAKENMRVYGSAIGSVTVECASCHDPHNDVNKTFLRISNTGSAVCLTCHIK